MRVVVVIELDINYKMLCWLWLLLTLRCASGVDHNRRRLCIARCCWWLMLCFIRIIHTKVMMLVRAESPVSTRLNLSHPPINSFAEGRAIVIDKMQSISSETEKHHGNHDFHGGAGP